MIRKFVCCYMNCKKISTFADITWNEHSKLTTPRFEHSSVILQDALYLLGDSLSSDSNTTEKLNIAMGQQKWTKSFDLQSAVARACTVKTFNEEILTIAGVYESSRKMFRYNVKTGDAVQYNNLPPTQV